MADKYGLHAFVPEIDFAILKMKSRTATARSLGRCRQLGSHLWFKMKILYLIFLIIFLQCQTKYLVYQRNSSGLSEKLAIKYKNEVFSYQADSPDLMYAAKGNFHFTDSVLYLEFPESAETKMLSPFKKGFSELVKTDESDHIEVEVLNFDVRSRTKLSPSRHFPSEIEILSVKDSTLIKKVPYPIVQFQGPQTTVLLRSKDHYNYDQYILIPDNGRYQLKLFLQPAQTFESYETTATNCYRVVSGPILLLRASGIENKLIKKLYPEGESYISYNVVEDPFSFVGIEKRKLRLF